jgi:hypothetical protein
VDLSAMTKEEITDIITSVEGVVIHHEPVPGGFRPLTRRYAHSGGVLLEHISYANPTTADGWAAVANITYEHGDVATVPIFRSWNISNHPVMPDVFRRVDLLQLNVDATRVQVLVAVKHFTDAARTEPAPVAARLMPLVGDNTMIMTVPPALVQLGYPTQMAERDYWDALTTLGKTPYELLDARIPELDALKRFDV